MATMQDDLSTLRRAIAGLSMSKTQRRYPAELQRRIVSVVRQHPQLEMPVLARRLDMAPQTLTRILSSAGSVLVPVRVTNTDEQSRSAVVVRGPCGVVVEGLDVRGVAELFRALS